MPTLLRALLASLLLILPITALAQAPALPGIDLKGLEKDEVEGLNELMQGGACPCNTKLSVYECVEKKTCEQATQLMQFAADKFREGFGPEQVQQAVVKKYFDEIMRFTFDLKDSPKKGVANGRVTIVEFADFECPHCSLVAKILPEVLKATRRTRRSTTSSFRSRATPSRSKPRAPRGRPTARISSGPCTT